MSISIDYWTATKVNASLRCRVEVAAAAFVRGRRWWAESLSFFPWPGKKGHLAGSAKVSRSDADVEDDQFMSSVDMLAILEVLAAWSAEFGVDWEVQLAGEKWGDIRNGKLETPLKKFCTQARKSLGKPAQAEKRSAEIFREYEVDAAATTTSKNAKTMQARWTAKQIRAINKFVDVKDSMTALLKNRRMHRRTLPADLVPTFTEAGLSWHDLRGYPLERCNALVADHVDFSYCKAPRSKQKSRPRLEIIMTNCHLEDCRFVESGPFYSCGGEFVRCDFTGAKLRGCNLLGTICRDCDFTKADLGRLVVTPNNVFQNCRFDQTRFVKAELGVLTFTDCVFRGCDWSGAFLHGIRFQGCDVRGENFLGTECPAEAFDSRSLTKGCSL